MKKAVYTFILSGMILAFSGCSGVRNLTPVQLDTPSKFASALTDSVTIADIEWWNFYSDSILRNIISRTLENNRDILIAAQRVEEMKELYGISRANMYPQVNGVIGANRETNDYHDKSHVNDPEYDVKATFSWEINLWGSLTWARRKGKQQFLASVEDQRAMRMILISEVATAYFNLTALDNELAIVKRTLATRLEGVEQARLRFEGGLTSETVYQQAKVEYATTAALVPNLERQITIARNAISLLMGEFPGDEISRTPLKMDQEMPDNLPVGLPSALLCRRPDLLASEHRLQAAMADVGVAYADRFPKFTISLTGGLENDKLPGLLASPFTYAATTVAGSIFDFGRRKRKYKASIAAYNEARLEYEKNVMTAFGEVSNAITTYHRRHEASLLKSELRDAARKYVELAHLQYRAGSLAYLDVLDAQRRYFDSQIGLSNAVRDEYLALVDLYKVLGGGWQVEKAQK